MYLPHPVKGRCYVKLMLQYVSPPFLVSQMIIYISLNFNTRLFFVHCNARVFVLVINKVACVCADIFDYANQASTSA
jgi:hypothetical protein